MADRSGATDREAADFAAGRPTLDAGSRTMKVLSPTVGPAASISDTTRAPLLEASCSSSRHEPSPPRLSHWTGSTEGAGTRAVGRPKYRQQRQLPFVAPSMPIGSVERWQIGGKESFPGIARDERPRRPNRQELAFELFAFIPAGGHLLRQQVSSEPDCRGELTNICATVTCLQGWDEPRLLRHFGTCFLPHGGGRGSWRRRQWHQLG